jgi:hypothetical protein
MNNDAYSKFVNQDFKNLACWIYSLNGYEFTLVATLVAFLIAPPLSINEQNSLGNFFEQMGQTLLTIAAQNQTIKHKNRQISNMKDGHIDDLHKEILRIKEELYQLRKDSLMNDNI